MKNNIDQYVLEKNKEFVDVGVEVNLSLLVIDYSINLDQIMCCEMDLVMFL